MGSIPVPVYLLLESEYHADDSAAAFAACPDKVYVNPIRLFRTNTGVPGTDTRSGSIWLKVLPSAASHRFVLIRRS